MLFTNRHIGIEFTRLENASSRYDFLRVSTFTSLDSIHPTAFRSASLTGFIMRKFVKLMHRCNKRNIPFSVVFESTYHCNLRCLHCYQRPRSGQELDLREIESLLDQLAELGCLYLALTGGEPLVRKDFFKIAEHARKRSFALKILTNATLVDQTISRQLKDLNFECADISIYGSSSNTHDRFTNSKGSFQKMMRGIEHLKNNNVELRFKMTISRFNVGEIDRVQALATKVGATFFAEPFITPRNDFNRTPLRFRVTDKDLDKVTRYFIKANQRYFCEEKGRGITCNSGRNVMAIAAQGDVYPCEGLQISAGNIRKNSLKEIWRNSTILTRIRNLKGKDFKDCWRCDAKKFCFRCMGLAYLEHKNYLLKSDIFCRVALSIKEQLKMTNVK